MPTVTWSAAPSSTASSVPLAPPPPGRTANLVDPVSNAWRLYITAAICVPAIIFFASIRAYLKLCIRRSRTWDDYTFMLGVIYTIIWIGLVVTLMNEGIMGRHIWELTWADLKNESFLLVLLTETLYGPFIWVIKLSLFLLYLEIFTPYRWLKHAAWGGIVVTGLFYASSSIAKLALCVPRRDESYIDAFGSQRCYRTRDLALCGGIFNILSDLYLLVLPIPGTLKLQVNRRKKCAIMAVFMTGIGALNASILGLHYRLQVDKDGDDTWNTMPLDLAMMIEMTAGLAVLAMPALRVVISEHQAYIMSLFKSGSTINEGSGSSNQVDIEFCLRSRGCRKLRDFRHVLSSSKESDRQTRPETSDETSLVDHFQILPKV